MRILITGATGYVGGRLVPRLLAAGHVVRCMVRDPSRLQGRAWINQVDTVAGDVLDDATVAPALAGIDVAYYLVHSMGSGHDFHVRDARAARAFGEAARAAGVQRLVYLGALGDPDTNLSEHLRSRQQTGDALRESGVPVTEFRAAVIVGAGSLSFEMIRYLAERVPIMICPSWVYTRVQPIAIRNVLDYLVTTLDVPESAGQVIEIGCADVISYGEMMTGYARVRGLRRLLVPVPVLTPRLSSYWVHLVTPIPSTIARPLIEGLRNEVVVRDRRAATLFPDVRPMGYDEAVSAALARLDAGAVETAWSDALASSQGDVPAVVMTTQDGMVIEHRQVLVDASPARVFTAFTAMGGQTGWLYMNWSWQLRGALDRLAGGVGMRRGRRHPQEVRVGDALDFWRVEAVEPDVMLLLRAEMKVPGRAWLQFQAREQEGGRTLITQTAFFAPRGLWGLVYWYALYPIHQLIFSGMIRRLAARA
jgi:uncharacterized protein YbjT (DUF2867 family)